MHPGKVGTRIFDRSSAHKGLAPDALNVNNMNVNPGGSSTKLMRSTIIPLNNPPPKPGRPDTRSMRQDMVYPANHPEQKLQGLPKGLKTVLEECMLVWDELMTQNGKVNRKCKQCKKSQVKKDAERRIAEAEAMG